MPVVLLSMAGNRLEVSTAVFTDAVYADKLLSLDLRLGPHGPDDVLRIARVFMAINECAKRLRELYSGFERLPKMLFGVMYPSPTADPPESTIPQLEFLSKLDRVDGIPLPEVNEDTARHGIYLARMPGVASTGDRRRLFWSSSPQNTTKPVIVSSPTTIPHLPRFCTNVCVS